MSRTWIWTRAVPFLALGVAMQALTIVLIGAGHRSLGWGLQGVLAGLVLAALMGALFVARDRKLLVGFTPSASDVEAVDWVGIRVGPTRSALQELGSDPKLLTSLYRVSISEGALTLRGLPRNSPVLVLDLERVSEVQLGYAIWVGKHSPAVILMIPISSSETVRLPLVMTDPADGPLAVVSGRDLDQRAAVLRSAVLHART